MEFKTFIRKPFTVEAVEITLENIMEVATLIGEIRTKGDETYIAVNRRIVPNITRAFVGWYLTRLGDNYRCYSPKVFKDQFCEHDPGTGYFFDDEEETTETPMLSIPPDESIISNVFEPETTPVIELVVEDGLRVLTDVRLVSFGPATDGLPNTSVVLTTNEDV